MNNGAFGENFPYSNFHDLNMDWIIKIAKDFLDQYSHIQETIQTGLDDLDAKATELERLLQEWYDTHSEDIANQLASALSDLNKWYTEHQNYLDQKLQNNINVFDNHAEQKALDTIATIPSDYTALSTEVEYIRKLNSYNALRNNITPETSTNHGVTCTKHSDGTFSFTGTATDSIATFQLFYDAVALPSDFIPGRKYFVRKNGGIAGIQFYWYKNGAQFTSFVADYEPCFVIPSDVTGCLIRFRIPQGTTINESHIRYEVVASSPYTDMDCLYSTGETSDRTNEIQEILEEYGVCNLGPGDFYVSNLFMPANSSLIGSGEKTRIILSESATYGIGFRNGNKVSNLSVYGSLTDIDVASYGTKNGIYYVGNHSTGTDADKCWMNNVSIYNCSRYGLWCTNTSINYAKSLYAEQLYIYGCHVGLQIDSYSEFNKFTNCNIAWCWYACINNGGNNVFTACTFHATDTGFYIDGSQPNSGHGTLNGCTFCHIGRNEGRAIYIVGCPNGFIINSCQIWYNYVWIGLSNGVIITNCEFGPSELIRIAGGGLTLISNCSFHSDINNPPTIEIIGTPKLQMINCYGGASGNLINP